MSQYAKDFLCIFFAFKTGDITNNTIKQFFQTKTLPPTLWNAWDYVIQFKIIIAHIPRESNSAADYLFQLEVSPKKKLFLRIREDIQTTPIDLHVQSAGVTKEEYFFFTEDDEKTEQQLRQRKKPSAS